MNTSRTMTSESNLEIKTDFKIEIAMKSDWHIGSGTGRRGGVDRLVKRDHNGLPYLPAKTITGIWRDACELLAGGLDAENGDTYFSRLVDYLFGDQPGLEKGAIATPPREAALSIRAAHFPEILSNAIKHKPLLREAIAFVKPGIKIDYENGCAIDDCLRFEEVVRGGITLKADCHLNLSENLPENSNFQKLCFAFLMASPKFFNKIGGKRRRGNGECAVTIENIDATEWILWLGNNLNSENFSLPQIPDRDSEDIKPKDRNEQNQEAWETIHLQITALSPIVISHRTVGNVVETLDYIPGTHLLGILIRQLAKHSLAVGINEAIAQNDLVVTNATIAIGDRPGYPTPFMLSGEKMGGGLAKGATIYNRFVDEPPKNIQLKPERGGYLTCEITNEKPSYPIFKKVEITAETHNIVDDAEQRPNQNTGGVYTYEAIAASTVCLAKIHMRKYLAESIAKTHQEWQTIFGGEVAIGQSKKDDYGRAKVSVLDSQVSSMPKAEPKTLTVWLLSDLLLRDDRLRPTSDLSFLQKELETKLGITLTQPAENLGIARSHRIDSWQVRWQLPRPSLVGLGAGSCIRFKISGEIDRAKLAEIERSGLGDRRVEGYGQVCFNHPLLSESLSKLESLKADGVENVGDRELIPKNTYARNIERVAWQKAIQARVLAKAEDRKELLHIEKDKPRMSQLGALRSVLSCLQSFENRGNAIAWLDRLKKTKNRQEKWHPKSLETIEKYLTQENQIWDDLGLDIAEITLTVTGEAELKKELWAEALYALVDACIRAQKRESESKPQNS
jgi:CRISPR-associated protein Csx10